MSAFAPTTLPPVNLPPEVASLGSRIEAVTEALIRARDQVVAALDIQLIELQQLQHSLMRAPGPVTVVAEEPYVPSLMLPETELPPIAVAGSLFDQAPILPLPTALAEPTTAIHPPVIPPPVPDQPSAQVETAPLIAHYVPPPPSLLSMPEVLPPAMPMMASPVATEPVAPPVAPMPAAAPRALANLPPPRNNLSFCTFKPTAQAAARPAHPLPAPDLPTPMPAVAKVPLVEARIDPTLEQATLEELNQALASAFSTVSRRKDGVLS